MCLSCFDGFSSLLDVASELTRDAEVALCRFGRKYWWLARPACKVGVWAISWWWSSVEKVGAQRRGDDVRAFQGYADRAPF